MLPKGVNLEEIKEAVEIKNKYRGYKFDIHTPPPADYLWAKQVLRRLRSLKFKPQSNHAKRKRRL